LQGVIAIDNVPIASVAAESERFNMPTVAIGYHQAASTIRCDDREGGRLLMRHLLGLGHRRIGLISVPVSEHLGIAERMAGLREEAAASDFAFDACPLVYGDFSVKSGADAASELLSQHADLTAIIALNDRMAMGAIQTVTQQGRRVPDDVSVVGFDNLSTAEMVNPPLTTIDQHGAEIGTQAAEILLGMLEDKHQMVQRVLAPTLVERASTGRAKDFD
jgi:DNA-binding LacI/PurR family transcriptional regulator